VPQTVHQSKFSMGFVLALIAREGRAGVHDFDEAAVMDGELLDLASRVEMVVDPVIDVAHPMRWMATVDVDTVDGRKLSATMPEPKGDPGNPLSREELEAKAIRVGTFANAISETQMIALIQRLWMLESAPQVGRLLPSQSPA